MGDYHANPRKRVTKHPNCVEVGECRPRHRGGKDTRRWCKGHVGIPHTWEWLRRRNDVEREQRMGITYNRITEEPVCFGCTKIDYRNRSYCRLCGEPWPRLVHMRVRARVVGVAQCARCGAPWIVRKRVGNTWVASGSVVQR